MSEQKTGGSGRHPLFMPLIFVGGLVFGAGLAVSRMARPEVVLDFLQFEDFGLLFVMGGAALVAGPMFHIATRSEKRAPLTDRVYSLRRKTMDSNVLAGGAVFGVGWGISGICPGAAYASVGIGNWPILYGIAGMLVGAYIQGVGRDVFAGDEAATAD
ncbi:DUF6691 family protein [Halolamina sp.]|jgi:hypothetical protein|uniref:DUF6691 family protein n=1 Tax=Halolamina sp. TaxID=1940283 RepID=UPI000223B7C1|nr:protein of unknown function DUF395 YeeE/YedE [halophilic archaeon DL31]